MSNRGPTIRSMPAPRSPTCCNPPGAPGHRALLWLARQEADAPQRLVADVIRPAGERTEELVRKHLRHVGTEEFFELM